MFKAIVDSDFSLSLFILSSHPLVALIIRVDCLFKMAPYNKASSASAAADGGAVAQRLAALKSGHHHLLHQPDDKWVPVSWMPHTTLSQTSHVCLEIRSALIIEKDTDSILDHSSGVLSSSRSKEWRVQATIQGMAGLPMVSSLIPCQTPAAAVVDSSSRKPSSSQLAIMGANRVCEWDCVLHLPIRWRDLCRDAYLQLEVLSGRDDQVVREEEE